MKDTDFIQWFRNASPYINAHRGKTFVVMFPGQCVAHAQFPHIVNDIALLNSLGIRLVLVYGARPQIDAHLQASGFQSEFHRGLRVTEATHIPAVSRAVGGLHLEIEAALSTGLPNSPMHGAHIRALSGNFVTAMPQGVIDGVDLQHTGKVRRIDANAINGALDRGNVVLVSCLGYSLTGEIFNLSYAEVATKIATALKADKLLALVDQSGIRDAGGELQRELQVADCGVLLKHLPAGTETVARLSLQACYEACHNGVERAHLIDYCSDGALLEELFSRDGSGTMVYSGSYESLRPATIDDVGGVLDLLEPLEQQGVLVRRSRELLETEIDRFRVIEKDGTIIACGALYPFDDASAELAALATRAEYRNQGRAALLLKNIERSARELGIAKLFVLTTQTAHWFVEQGFAQSDVTQLPAKRQQLYNYQRNSKVFTKSLESPVASRQKGDV